MWRLICNPPGYHSLTDVDGINQSIKMLLAACRDTEGCMKGCAGGMEGVCRGTQKGAWRGHGGVHRVAYGLHGRVCRGVQGGVYGET